MGKGLWSKGKGGAAGGQVLSTLQKQSVRSLAFFK